MTLDTDAKLDGMNNEQWISDDGSVQEPMHSVRIYAVLDPDSNDVRYVGKTYRTLYRRLTEHLLDCKKKSHTHAGRWFAKMRRNGIRPVVFLLETVPAGGDWQKAEAYWIRRFRQKEKRLVNATDGGEGRSGWHMPEESRLRIAAALRTGSHFNCETCGEQFWRKRNQISKGDCRFCSRECFHASQKGKSKPMPHWVVLAGRAAAVAKRAANQHCKRGHLLSGDNLYVNTAGSRVCKECRKIHKRSSYAKSR